jgi:hypothetical protein
MKTYRILLKVFIITLTVLYSTFIYAGEEPEATSEYQRTKRNMQEDKESLDEQSKKLIRQRLKALYQPPFHIGVNFGLGLTSTSVPNDYKGLPKLGMQANLITTYYFKDYFAFFASAGWNRFRGFFDNLQGDSAYFTTDYFSIQTTALLQYKEGFFYIGPVFGILINSEKENATGSYNFAESKSVNVGLAVGGGWRVDFLYKLRMHVGLELKYFFDNWMDKPGFKPFGVYFKIAILYGIGSPPEDY